MQFILSFLNGTEKSENLQPSLNVPAFEILHVFQITKT